MLCSAWLSACCVTGPLHRGGVQSVGSLPGTLSVCCVTGRSPNGGVIKMAITAKELSMKTVPLPPLDLQNQFANFVKSVEQQKEVFTARLSHLETLYKSLMQEYFG